MLKLLVAVDGSDNALRAVRFVRGLADRGLPVHAVLLAVRPPVLSGEVGAVATLALAEERRAMSSAAALSDALSALSGISPAPVVQEASGDPAAEIAYAAEAHHCDGIVMGRRGLGVLRSALLGSVSDRVVRIASIPVTLVR